VFLKLNSSINGGCEHAKKERNAKAIAIAKPIFLQMWQLIVFNLNVIYLLFINFNWFKEEKKSILTVDFYLCHMSFSWAKKCLSAFPLEMERIRMQCWVSIGWLGDSISSNLNRHGFNIGTRDSNSKKRIRLIFSLFILLLFYLISTYNIYNI